MKSYVAILFDIDDTLVDLEQSETISLTHCHELFFKDIVDLETFLKDYNSVNRPLWRLAEEGKIRPADVGAERFKQMAARYQIPMNHQLPGYYDQQLLQNSTWTKGAIELLDALKSKNVKMGFITNGFSQHKRRQHSPVNLTHYSDVFSVSEEVGVAKPHPQIFLHALNQMKTDPARTLMVGDSLTSDGAGARKLGLPFCWYNPKKIPHPEGWRPDMIISDLEGVLKVLP